MNVVKRNHSQVHGINKRKQCNELHNEKKKRNSQEWENKDVIGWFSDFADFARIGWKKKEKIVLIGIGKMVYK